MAVEETLVGMSTDEAAAGTGAGVKLDAGLALDPGAAVDFWVSLAKGPQSTMATGTFVEPGRGGEEVEEPETGTGAGVELKAGTGPVWWATAMAPKNPSMPKVP